MITNFLEYITEKRKTVSRKIRDAGDFLTKQGAINKMSPTMPDELLEYIISWSKIRKSPLGQSWYNSYKDWNFFTDGGIRVADHWNFRTKRDYKIHCKTKQKGIENNKYWYVGVYDKENDDYNIIKKYPILDRIRSQFLVDMRKQLSLGLTKDEYKEMSKEEYENLKRLKYGGTPEEIEKLREFKDRLKDGKVKARLENGDIVTVEWRGKRGTGKKRYRVIKYKKNGEILETPNYEIIDEVLKK